MRSIQVCEAPGEKVVQDHDIVAILNQPLRETGAYETSTTGEKQLHRKESEGRGAAGVVLPPVS